MKKLIITAMLLATFVQPTFAKNTETYAGTWHDSTGETVKLYQEQSADLSNAKKECGSSFGYHYKTQTQKAVKADVTAFINEATSYAEGDDSYDKADITNAKAMLKKLTKASYRTLQFDCADGGTTYYFLDNKSGFSISLGSPSFFGVISR
nr:hypothetical protein [uncultured Moraxella sp.]